MRLLLVLLLLPLLTAGAPSDTAPLQCTDCAAWNAPRAPFRIWGNTSYVGVEGLSSVVIDTGEGLILLDGALPQSAPRIAENLRTLGLDLRRVKWILNSHAHFDHAGGIAALQRLSGAKVGASADGAKALRKGGMTPEDPQAAFGARFDYPAVRKVEVVKDGQRITLGTVTVTAHATPGHTPGGMTWSWKSCEAERCVDVVYGESLTAVSSDDFHFSAKPGRVEQFRASIAKVRALPCDVLIPTHPSAGRLFAQAEASAREGPEAFLDPAACRAYAERADAGLSARVKQESAGKAP